MDVRTENRGRLAPKSALFCGPGDGEKLFDPGASRRKGQQCPQEIWTKTFMFMLFFLACISDVKFGCTAMTQLCFSFDVWIV